MKSTIKIEHNTEFLRYGDVIINRSEIRLVNFGDTTGNVWLKDSKRPLVFPRDVVESWFVNIYDYKKLNDDAKLKKSQS